MIVLLVAIEIDAMPNLVLTDRHTSAVVNIHSCRRFYRLYHVDFQNVRANFFAAVERKNHLKFTVQFVQLGIVIFVARYSYALVIPRRQKNGR